MSFSIPAAILILPYVVFLAFFAFFSASNLAALSRYKKRAHESARTIIVSYVAIVLFILALTIILGSTIDWAQPIGFDVNPQF